MSTDFGSIFIRILGGGAFLLGLYLFRVTYKLFRKLFYAKVIAVLPLDREGPLAFDLTEPYRIYGIWLKGRWLKKNPLTNFKPQIVNAITNEIVHLHKTFLGANSNNMKDAYVQLFWFKAEAGSYIFEKTNNSSLSSLSTIFNDKLIQTKVSQFNLHDFSFELREDLHPVFFLGLIFSILASLMFTLGGVFLFLGAEFIAERFVL